MRFRKVRRFIVIGCIAFITSLLTSFVLFSPVESARKIAGQPAMNIQTPSINSNRIANTVGTVSTFSTDGSSEHISRCLPSRATNVRKIAMQDTTTQAGDITHELSYHLFNYYYRGDFQQAVILDFKGVCGLAYDSKFGLAMSEMVPMDVARSLVLQNYRVNAAEYGGIEEFGRLLIESLTPSLGGTLPRFTPEQIWALSQLGIHLPEDQYTIKEITPYEPGRFTR